MTSVFLLFGLALGLSWTAMYVHRANHCIQDSRGRRSVCLDILYCLLLIVVVALSVIALLAFLLTLASALWS